MTARSRPENAITAVSPSVRARARLDARGQLDGLLEAAATLLDVAADAPSTGARSRGDSRSASATARACASAAR